MSKPEERDPWELGWSKLPRSIASYDVLFDRPRVGLLFLWLTARASSERRPVAASHGVVWLEPGESVTSFRTISARLGCSIGTARRSLEVLETIGLVYTKRSPSGSVIGVLNYGKNPAAPTSSEASNGSATDQPRISHGSAADHPRYTSEREELRGKRKESLGGNAAAQVLESFNQTFGRKLKIETWKRVIERALQSGKTTRELRGVIWWANGRDYYQERKAEIDPSWLFRLSSKDGRKTLPQMLELATEEWEATQGEPCPWKSE